MNEQKNPPYYRLLPVAVFGGFLLVWELSSKFGVFPEYSIPSPMSVAHGFVEETRGHLFDDVIASLFRVMFGFGLSVTLGVPFGLWLGLKPMARAAFLPAVNFFRALSPLAWIPFAVIWFQLGDKPAVFLIWISAFFPVVLATMAAVANLPKVYFRVAEDYGITGWHLLTRVTLPAIMPQVITSLRVVAGLSWLVVVAAEMLAGKEGLGFLIWDARNGLRSDLVVVGMIMIGIIGVILDRLLVQLTKIPSVRWGYER